MTMSDITVEYLDHMGSDLDVVNAAKVSFGKQSEWEMGTYNFGDGLFGDMVEPLLSRKDTSLINYLARGMTTKDYDAMIRDMRSTYETDEIIEMVNQYRDTPIHKSPFNHCYIKFRVTAPIYTARQLVKHEYLPWNEISGRYVQFEPDFFKPRSFRAKAEDKKQGSGLRMEGQAEVDLKGVFDDAHAFAYSKYKQALALGLCEEQARSLLPLDTMTQWIWSGSLGAFAKMVKLRTAPDSQYEARIVATKIMSHMEEYFPTSMEALMTNGGAKYHGSE